MFDSQKDLSVFDDDDISAIVNDELSDSEERYTPATHPRAILLAGQPGAGKTGISDLMISLLQGNALFINADDPSISRITIWDRELRCLFDSAEDPRSPSLVISQFWNRPWSGEELLEAEDNILFLRRQEAETLLGQSSAIDELERRISLQKQKSDYSVL